MDFFPSLPTMDQRASAVLGFTKAKPSFDHIQKKNWIRSSHLQSCTWKVRKPNIYLSKKIKTWYICCSRVPGPHVDAVPAPTYDRNSSSPLTFLCPLTGCKTLDFMLPLENRQSVAFGFFLKKLHSCCSQKGYIFKQLFSLLFHYGCLPKCIWC